MPKTRQLGESNPPVSIEFQQPLLINAKEGARLLGISEIHFRRLALSGTIPSFTVGRSRRFSRRALERWIEEQSR